MTVLSSRQKSTYPLLPPTPHTHCSHRQRAGQRGVEVRHLLVGRRVVARRRAREEFRRRQDLRVNLKSDDGLPFLRPLRSEKSPQDAIRETLILSQATRYVTSLLDAKSLVDWSLCMQLHTYKRELDQCLSVPP